MRDAATAMTLRAFTQAVEIHSDGLLDAAMAAGPGTGVPTCPQWTVARLVRHIARVQSLAVAAIRDPTGEHVKAGTAPQEWEPLLAWWARQRAQLRAALDAPADQPAWLPFSGIPRTVGSWARRQAHEAAIHRLDAELATRGDPVTFEPGFAADGVDELLTLLVQRGAGWERSTVAGTVLLHAEDVGRLWSVRLQAGKSPLMEDQRRREPDVTIEGPADAVYKAMWRRPSTARIAGDTTLLEPLAAP